MKTRVYTIVAALIAILALACPGARAQRVSEDLPPGTHSRVDLDLPAAAPAAPAAPDPTPSVDETLRWTAEGPAKLAKVEAELAALKARRPATIVVLKKSEGSRHRYRGGSGHRTSNSRRATASKPSVAASATRLPAPAGAAGGGSTVYHWWMHIPQKFWEALGWILAVIVIVAVIKAYTESRPGHDDSSAKGLLDSYKDMKEPAKAPDNRLITDYRRMSYGPGGGPPTSVEEHKGVVDGLTPPSSEIEIELPLRKGGRIYGRKRGF